ncbi:hypothetical protein FRB94_012982 [Tulasnella sp. JGI-2019a]|nr:hypothetical protein FRB94_012982 [Tulasnella sp. JGI-2019a]
MDELPQSAPRIDWVSFSGDASENVLVFAQGVLRSALAYGRQKDFVWMADFAYGGLSGYALEWFEHLDIEVKQDWSRLRPIMMERFLPNRGAFNSTSRARVRVVRRSGEVLGYMSSPVPNDYPTVVATVEKALVLTVPIEYTARDATTNIRTVVSQIGWGYKLESLISVEVRLTTAK